MPIAHLHLVLLTITGFIAGGMARTWARRLLGRQPRGHGLLPRLLLAGAWCAVGWRYGVSLQTAELCLLCLALVTITLTDVTGRVIPNECLVGALGVRAAYLALLAIGGEGSLRALVLRSLAGGVCTLVPLLVLALVADWLTGTESLGGGDLKLLTVMGCYMGAPRLALVLLLSCILALAWAILPVLRRGRVRRTFAFGPSIALAALAVLVAEPHVEGWLATIAF